MHSNVQHEVKTIYYCPIQECKYSESGGGSFFKRKDRAKRHLGAKHKGVGRSKYLEVITVEV